MTGRFRLRRGLVAALSVVVGAASAVAINIATSSPGWAVIAGAVVLVSLWALLEWRRAVDSDDASRQRMRIGQRVRRVRKGDVVGAQGLPDGADLEVNQRVSDVGPGGSVIGFRDDGD